MQILIISYWFYFSYNLNIKRPYPHSEKTNSYLIQTYIHTYTPTYYILTSVASVPHNSGL